jgi:PAS domain S-box-containing protein
MSEPDVPRPSTDYAAVFDRAAVGVFIASADGRYLDANPYGLAMLGYTLDELTAKTLADLVVPDEPGHVPPRLAELRSGSVVIAERQLRRKDGGVLSAEIAARRLPDGTMLGVVSDVSERRRTQDRLEQLARLYALTSAVNAAIVRTTDPPALFAAMCRIAVEHGGLRMAWCGEVGADGKVRPVAHAGLDDGYVAGLDIDITSPATGLGPVGTAARTGTVTIIEDIERDPRMARWRQPALARGYRSVASVPLRRGGKVVAVLSLYAATASFFSEDERALLVGIGDDVSFALGLFEAEAGRLAAEHALRRSEARMERVLAASPATIYTLAIEGQEVRMTWVSPDNLRAVLGYAPDDLRDVAWWYEQIHPDDRARVREGQARLFLDGRLAHEYRFRAHDGRYVWILDQLVVLRDDAGQPREVIGAWTDITHRREAEDQRLTLERQLLEAQKLESLGVLAGGIAHDFNNLLMAIIGHLELVTLELPAGASVRANVEQAARAAHRAAHLTRQMLAYSGRGRFVIAVLDLAALVAEHVGLLRASLPRWVTIELAAAEVAPIEADAGQVQQVVMNLITNAADAIGARPGRIALRVYEETLGADALAGSRVEPPPAPGRFVALTVDDDGCGMDDETRRRLFEPFFTTKAQGRGLGMAAILGIVRAHRGAMFVDSEPGRGSRFRVLFPLAAASAHAGVAARTLTPTAVPGSLPRRVLLVDDEERLRRIGERLLRHLGIDTLLASDGIEAVDVFARHKDEIDLVLLDLSMPRMDGFGALAALRELRADLPVLLSSGYDQHEAIRRIPDGAAIGSLRKPYSLEALRRKLTEVWAQARGGERQS